MSDAVAAAFAPLEVISFDGRTVISGDALDQSALHGALHKIEAFALELLTIETADDARFREIS